MKEPEKQVEEKRGSTKEFKGSIQRKESNVRVQKRERGNCIRGAKRQKEFERERMERMTKKMPYLMCSVKMHATGKVQNYRQKCLLCLLIWKADEQ